MMMTMSLATLLVFLRGTAGATFFLNYEGKKQVLTCNASSQPGRTAWWFGGQSTQTFKNRGPLSTCLPGKTEDPCYTEGNELHTAFPHGQIVACKSETETKCPKGPLFTNEECREFDFFILAKTKRTEQKTLQVKGKKFSLPCEFELKPKASIFTVYWIKEADQTTCLLSISNEDEHDIAHFSYNTNCCVDANIKSRIRNGSKIVGSDKRRQNHEITIVDVTSSDSGAYLCVVNMFAQPRNWRIVTNTSVIVEDPPSPTGSNYVLEISLGIAVTGAVLIGGIVLFCCWKKKTKATASEQQQRDDTTAGQEVDDCSPYALCSRNDMDGNQVIYSLAMNPGVNPNRASSLLDASEPQHGENVEALYSVVSKDRS